MCDCLPFPCFLFTPTFPCLNNHQIHTTASPSIRSNFSVISTLSFAFTLLKIKPPLLYNLFKIFNSLCFPKSAFSSIPFILHILYYWISFPHSIVSRVLTTLEYSCPFAPPNSLFLHFYPSSIFPVDLDTYFPYLLFPTVQHP